MIAHCGVRRVLLAAGRVAEVDEQREADEDHHCADHLAAPDVLLRQHVAERQREHHGGDEQGLDHREAAAVERGGLERVAGEQRQRSDQPHLLAEQPDEGLRICERDRREVERALLLQRRREREQECGDECEGFGEGHAADPSADATVPRRSR